MFKHFIKLEWKSFFRSASFATNLALKIIMGLGALYFMVCFAILGSAVFFILKEEGLEPLSTINTYIIYYLVGDLIMRWLIQKMPVTNIKPLLTLPIKRSTIVHYSLGKTAISFFNIIHAFFFLPFTIVLLIEGYGYQAILWSLAMMALIYANNFLNVIINNKDIVFYPLVAVVASLGLAQYYQFFNITEYTKPFFKECMTPIIYF